MAGDFLVTVFNLVEGFFWVGLGIFCLRRVRQGKKLPFLHAGLLLIVFGFTDWFEIFTGAWWVPWQLLVAKAICVFGLSSILLRTRASQR